VPGPSDGVRLERGPVARLTLDRPPLNILNTRMLEELAGAAAEAGSDAATRVIVVTGARSAFCAGVDIHDHTADRVDRMMATFARALAALRASEVPVIAAVNGTALGGGFEIALACDVVLARAASKLGQPEVRLGVFPPAAAALLPRLAGRQRALDLILTGRMVEAEEAQALGLVTRVLAADTFQEEVDAYAAGLAALSKPVLRLAKRAVVAGLERPLSDALREADRLYVDELMTLHDPHEGLAAFMEKRAPVWSDA